MLLGPCVLYDLERMGGPTGFGDLVGPSASVRRLPRPGPPSSSSWCSRYGLRWGLLLNWGRLLHLDDLALWGCLSDLALWDLLDHLGRWRSSHCGGGFALLDLVLDFALVACPLGDLDLQRDAVHELTHIG